MELLSTLNLDWKRLLGPLYHKSAGVISDLLEKHEQVVREELGELWNLKVKINIDSIPCPWFCKAHSVPYALQARVEEEL